MKRFLSYGNSKLPKTTAIFNFTSATNCPSKAAGKCNHPDICYAMHSEIQYRPVLPYRENQTAVFDSMSGEDLGVAMLNIFNRKIIKINKLRFSEAGDFRSQDDVDKFTKTASILRAAGIKVYGYVANDDFDYSELKKYASINGQGFTVTNQINVVDQFTETTGVIKCKGDCRICSACANAIGKIIEIKKH